MALGARTVDVLRSVVGRALVLASIGVAIGIVGAAAFGRVIQSQLFNVSLFDPLTFIGVISVLLGSAALASLLPARRAAGVDPATAFRQS
jgi:putative ABC transport system permease protein